MLIATKSTLASVLDFRYKINVNTLEEEPCGKLDLNEIAMVDLQFIEDVSFDNYQQNRQTGAFIIIDRLTNVTVGAGMVETPLSRKITDSKKEFSQFEIELNSLIRKHFPHWGAKSLIYFFPFFI